MFNPNSSNKGMLKVLGKKKNTINLQEDIPYLHMTIKVQKDA